MYYVNGLISIALFSATLICCMVITGITLIASASEIKKTMSTLKPEQSEHLIKLLKQRKQALIEAIAQSAQPVKLDQQAFGRVTRVDALQRQSMAKASLEQSKQQLRQVLMALARFESGDYGYCLECNRPIQFARLEIRPESSLCIDCQSGRELADR